MIDPESLASARAPFDTLPVDGPKIVGARMPSAAAERERVMLLLGSGIDLPALPRYYVPYEEVVDDLKAKAQPLDALVSRKPDTQAALDAAVAKLGVPRASLATLPVVGRLQRGTALVEASSGKVLVVVPVDPY